MKLWAMADEDLDEVLAFDLVATGANEDNGPGRSVGTFSIAIADATTPMVSVKDGAYGAIKEALGDPPMLYKGGSGELLTDGLFDNAAGMVSVAVGTSSDSGAVSVSAGGGAVTLAGVQTGETEVTVTATATPVASSLTVSQTVSNVALLTFPVTVVLKDLEVTLSGPEDTNLAEGMSAAITATANRAVEADTVIELIQTEGTAAPVDYTVEPLTIMAGETTGDTTLTAVEDETMENMESMTRSRCGQPATAW